MTKTVARKIAVRHDYYWLDQAGEWHGPEQGHNNSRELHRGDDIANDIKAYKKLFEDRLGKVIEHKFGRLFEGIYGYRWVDRDIVIITTKTTTEEEIV